MRKCLLVCSPISLWVSACLVLAGCSGVNQQAQDKRTPNEAFATPARPPLTVEEVFQWRSQYSDLLGKNRDAVIARYGEPKPKESDAINLMYNASEKTDGRGILFLISGSKVLAVKVFPKAGDNLDVVEVIKRAHLFEFSTGVFKDSTRQYFVASTKDKRNSIQFDVSESGVSLAAVIIASP